MELPVDDFWDKSKGIPDPQITPVKYKIKGHLTRRRLTQSERKQKAYE